MKKNILFAMTLVLLVMPMAFAASISISQAGADTGTVMKSNAFSVTVSGLSSSGTVALTLPSGFSTSESSSKSYGEGTTSVSWTTIIADSKLTGQTIRATINTGGSPENVETSSFDVVLPPSFVTSSSPSSFSATNQNGTYYANITFNVQNWGETTAKDVVATLSKPSEMIFVPLSSDAVQTLGTIAGGPGGSGESKGVSWRIYTTSSVSGNAVITITSSNADSSVIYIPVSISYASGSSNDTVAGSPSGGSNSIATTTTLPSKTQSWSTMTKGTVYNMTNFDSSIPISQISIQVSNTANSVRLTISNLAAKPSFITSNPSGTAYKYIDITVANLSNSNINSSVIEFSVEKWWLDLNKLDKNSVVLNRYSGGSWNALSTSFIRETANYDIYEAQTPGFSTFVITAKASSTNTTVSASDTTEDVNLSQESNATGTDFSNIILPPGTTNWILFAIVIIVLSLVIYLKRDSLKNLISSIGKGNKPWENNAK